MNTILIKCTLIKCTLIPGNEILLPKILLINQNNTSVTLTEGHNVHKKLYTVTCNSYYVIQYIIQSCCILYHIISPIRHQDQICTVIKFQTLSNRLVSGYNHFISNKFGSCFPFSYYSSTSNNTNILVVSECGGHSGVHIKCQYRKTYPDLDPE